MNTIFAQISIVAYIVIIAMQALSLGTDLFIHSEEFSDERGKRNAVTMHTLKMCYPRITSMLLMVTALALYAFNVLPVDYLSGLSLCAVLLTTAHGMTVKHILSRNVG